MLNNHKAYIIKKAVSVSEAAFFMKILGGVGVVTTHSFFL